jgi:hypothetical protein
MNKPRFGDSSEQKKIKQIVCLRTGFSIRCFIRVSVFTVYPLPNIRSLIGKFISGNGAIPIAGLAGFGREISDPLRADFPADPLEKQSRHDIEDRADHNRPAETEPQGTDRRDRCPGHGKEAVHGPGEGDRRTACRCEA